MAAPPLTSAADSLISRRRGVRNNSGTVPSPDRPTLVTTPEEGEIITESASTAQLTFLLGCEFGGLYAAADAFRAGGINVGVPRPELANTAVALHQPDHGNLWQWQALRRYFADLGLPPIAEVPPALLSAEHRSFQVRTFARCLGRSLDRGSPFFYADHLGALALPLLIEAAGQLGVSWAAWFFFSHPGAEMNRLRQERGVPLPLSEFVWRNVAACAVVHGGEAVGFVDMASLNPASWERLSTRICAAPTPLPAWPHSPAPFPRPPLSPHTVRLYEALVEHAAGKAPWSVLHAAALAAHQAMEEQSGWQYFDCLDCGALDAQAQRLLARAQHLGAEAASLGDGPPEEDPRGTAERELLRQQRDFATRLFLHDQSLRIRYQNSLEDLRRLHAREIEALKEQGRRRHRRRKERLRRFMEKARPQ